VQHSHVVVANRNLLEVDSYLARAVHALLVAAVDGLLVGTVDNLLA